MIQDPILKAQIRMKFSSNIILYPVSRPLEHAVEHYQGLLTDQIIEDTAPDARAVEPDNFIHTRGNFECPRYTGKLFEDAREKLETALTEASPEQAPLDWAALQNSLGNILAALGQQQNNDDLYAMAMQSFNHALEVYSQDKTPQEWAWAQYNLGTAAQELGRKQSDSKLLKMSVDAYTNALLEWTRKETPLEWALAMHQLGSAFHSHGKLLKGNRTFQKSVVAYKNALAELDADNTALELAATHNNRGAVLHNLGESEENPDRLEEALRAYETALDICMQAQLSIHLAVICRINKATARCMLAELTKDATAAEESADELELIIECFHGACQPEHLAHCEQQLTRTRSMVEAFSGKAVETD